MIFVKNGIHGQDSIYDAKSTAGICDKPAVNHRKKYRKSAMFNKNDVFDMKKYAEEMKME